MGRKVTNCLAYPTGRPILNTWIQIWITRWTSNLHMLQSSDIQISNLDPIPKFGLWNVRSSNNKIKLLIIINQLPDRNFHLAVLSVKISKITTIPSFTRLNLWQITNSIPIGGVALVSNDLQLQIQEFKPFLSRLAKITIKFINNSLGIIDCYVQADHSPRFLKAETFYRQLDMVLRNIKSKCDSVVIMGDFNCCFGPDAHDSYA